MDLLGFLSLQTSVLQPRPRFAPNNAGRSGASICGVRMDTGEGGGKKPDKKKKELTKRQMRQRILRQDNFERHGFSDMKDIIEEKMDNAYSADITKEFRENDYTIKRGDVKWRIAQAYGFCWGVDRAVSQAFQAVEKYPDRRIFITNEIIHNPEVNEQMKALGVQFVPMIDGMKDFSSITKEDIVILPAFGATLEEMQVLEQTFKIVDTTCPYVSNVWRAIDDHSRKDVTTIVHGKYNHEETIATVSFSNRYLIVLNMAEAEYVSNYILNGGDRTEFMEKFKNAMSEGFDPDVDLKAVGIANQTTMLKSETYAIGKLFESTMMKIHDEQAFPKSFVSQDTICNATQVRQDAMIELLEDKDLDLIIVIGGFNSSNTSHLQEMAELRGVPSYWVDRAERVLPGNKIWARTAHGEERLVEEFLPKGPIKIGITSGASSPDSALQATIEHISREHSLL